MVVSTPNYDDIIADIRTALEDIQNAITPNQNTNAVSAAQQVDSRYWTALFSQSAPDYANSGSGILQVNETVICLYRAGKITEGSDTEKEAQRIKGQALLTFVQRPFLQCTSFPNGVEGLAPNGLDVQDVRIVSVDNDPSNKHWGVQATLIIPLNVSIDSDFDF